EFPGGIDAKTGRRRSRRTKVGRVPDEIARVGFLRRGIDGQCQGPDTAGHEVCEEVASAILRPERRPTVHIAARDRAPCTVGILPNWIAERLREGRERRDVCMSAFPVAPTIVPASRSSRRK